MKIHHLIKSIVVAIGTVVTLISCNDDAPKVRYEDTLNSGVITIAVDENYAPVMNQQLKIFDSSFPEATIKVNYLPQEACFESLLNDSVRMVVAARDLNELEKKYFEDNKINVRSLAIAVDAVGVIVHPSSPDSVLNIEMLTNIIKGDFVRKYNIVFDHQKSGVVRFIKEQLISGDEFKSNTFALQTSDSVINYVAQNKNAIGFVSVGHLYDPNDESGQGYFKQNIRVVALENDSATGFYEPYQANLFDNHYPLRRKLYFHLREAHRGLGTGFANFISQQRGQTIFYREKMLPLRVPLTVRETEIKK
jgi:phosphate transport system substrate-binding protein